MEYCFSYHKYPWLCLLKVSPGAAGTRSVSAEGVRDPPFPGRGSPSPGLSPPATSSWENNLVSSSVFWLSSLQLHSTGSQNSSSVFGCLPAQGRALSWAVPPGWISLSSSCPSCPTNHQDFLLPIPLALCVPLTIAPPMCEFCQQQLCPIPVSLPLMGQPRALGQASAWARCLLGKHTHPSPHLPLLLW